MPVDSQHKPQVAIPLMEVNRHTRGTDKQAEEQRQNHGDMAKRSNFATGALPCQPACICEVSVLEVVVASLLVSNGIWPPSRGQGAEEPLASFLYCGFLPLSDVDKYI